MSMLRRCLAIAFVAWAVLAAPSLCRAAVLEHLCPCGVSASCEHEESCSADPCAIAKPATEAKAGLDSSGSLLLALGASAPAYAPVLPSQHVSLRSSEGVAVPPCHRVLPLLL
jgi:hypothetical protein